MGACEKRGIAYNCLMSLNCNEINVILDELNLEGAFIQDIIQPGVDTLAFYTYKVGCAKTVIVCTAQNAVRINEARRKITKNDKPLRFMEFLRASFMRTALKQTKNHAIISAIFAEVLR